MVISDEGTLDIVLGVKFKMASKANIIYENSWEMN